MQYTLARHGLWTVSHFPRFRRGLEPRAIGPAAVPLIAESGGVVLDSLDEAWDAAEGFMYPLGDTTTTPNPYGHFVEIARLGLLLFVPTFSGDLLAV